MGSAAAGLTSELGGARRLQPAPADEFVASVGLCVHLASAPYAEMFNEVLRWARSLGVRHFRDDLRPSDDLRRWRVLFDQAGVRAHLLVSPSTNSPGDMIDYVRALGPKIVAAIEGQNEGDSAWFQSQPSGQPSWARAVIDYQQSVYEAVRAEYPADILPVVSPTVLDYRPLDMQALREAAPYCDIVALHAYVQEEQQPETEDPYAGLEWYLREMRDPFKPGAPAMITEAGYRTGSTGVSARAAAVYLPRLLLNAFDRGIVRSFIYEMLDEGQDASDPEQNYGLIGADGAPKPAYHALCVLLNALSDPGPTFSPERFAIELRHAPPDLRCCTFAKRDGERWLALWRALPVWDKAAKVDLPFRPAVVEIGLDRAPRQASMRRVWPESRWEMLPDLTLSVSDVVTLVRLIV